MPVGVPVSIIVPASSLVLWDKYEICLRTSKIMSAVVPSCTILAAVHTDLYVVLVVQTQAADEATLLACHREQELFLGRRKVAPITA